MTITTLFCADETDYLTCGNVPVGGLNALTVEGWFFTQARSVGNRPWIMQYGTGSAGKQYALYGTRDGRVYFVVFTAGELNAAYSLPAAWQTNRWQHIAGCYCSGACSVWVDGVDVTFASRARGGAVSATAQAVQVGGAIGFADFGFVGRLGWGRISDACRLPATVAGPESPPSIDGNTLAQWNMAEGSGSTVDNAAGDAAYDATIVGASWVSSDTSKTRAAPPITGRQGYLARAQAPITGRIGRL